MSGSDATGAQKLRYRNLLEEAVSLASEGEIEKAIGRIREALDLAINPRVISTVEHHLRLPSFSSAPSGWRRHRRNFVAC